MAATAALKKKKKKAGCRGAERTALSSEYGEACWYSLCRPADHGLVSPPHLQSNSASLSLSALSASFCHFHVQAPFVLSVETARGRSGGKQESSSQGDHSATKEHLTYTPPPKKIHTHIHPTHWASTRPPLPRLTNVPWHSYITRKLAKWINHGPCLALRALNGFSPLQVCPIIAFIHLVARFTHSLRSRQSPGCIFRSGGKSVRDLSSDHNRLFKQQLTWQLRRMSMSGSLLDRTLERWGAFYLFICLHISCLSLMSQCDKLSLTIRLIYHPSLQVEKANTHSREESSGYKFSLFTHIFRQRAEAGWRQSCEH